MQPSDKTLRASLVAWLRWHAPSAAERQGVPDACIPLLDTMARASGTQAVARLATEIENADEQLASIAANYEAVHDELRAEIATLTGVINAIVDEPVSMLLAQAANLVRLVGPDDWPVDAIPRSSVVDMAMRVKDAADRQRSIARDRGQRT